MEDELIFFNQAAVQSAAIPHRHQPEEVAECGDEGCHVGERGGVEKS